MKKNVRFILVVLLITIIFQSCKTTKTTEATVHSVEEGREKISIKSISDNQFLFDWMNVKLSGNYLGISFNGQLRMKKDSVIWMSLYAFGIVEIGRLKATQDSVMILTKNPVGNDEYFIGSYGVIEQLIGVKTNLNMLEALLVGNDFNCFDTIRYKLIDNETVLNFIFMDRAQRQNCSGAIKQGLIHLKQSLVVNKESYKITRNTMSPLELNHQLQIDYLKYQKVDNMLFPKEINIAFVSSSDSGKINFTFEKPTLGKTQTFPFNISNKAIPMRF